MTKNQIKKLNEFIDNVDNTTLKQEQQFFKANDISYSDYEKTRLTGALSRRKVFIFPKGKGKN